MSYSEKILVKVNSTENQHEIICRGADDSMTTVVMRNAEATKALREFDGQLVEMTFAPVKEALAIPEPAATMEINVVPKPVNGSV